MNFEAPIWLYLTPLVCLLFGSILAYGFRQRDALLGRFAASRLLDQLTEKASRSRTWIKASCILLAVLAIGIALARPQLGVEWSERKARGLDIVFVLDSSKSMLATDLRPTRLDRAKLAIIDLIERLESDRIGLVAFAGQAFLQTPPTLDYAAFRESLEAIDPGIMTSGGSDLGNAIKEAAEAFPSENNVKVVVLLTDGEDLSGHAVEAAETASSSGIQVFAIGIGTPEGEYLKTRNDQGIEEFVRDASGQPVRSQLDEATLQKIAQLTGGSYSRLSGASLDKLYSSVIATLPRTERESELQEIHIERFQWVLSAALFFLVLDILIRRRRSAAIHSSLICLAALSFSPQTSQAQTEAPPDATSIYNSAYKALTAGEYESALELYGSALEQSEDLSLQRDALYNMGHASYQQGLQTYQGGDLQGSLEQMKKAEQLFQSAQEVDPNDADLKTDVEQISKVRETIEKLIEQQQEQENQDQAGENSDDQQDQSDQQDQDDSQQGDQQNQDQSQQGNEPEPQQGDQSSEPEQSQDGQQGEESQEDKQDQQNDGSQQDQQGDQGQQGQPNQENSQDASQNQNSPQGEQSEDQTEPQDPNAGGEEERDAESQGAGQESTQDPVDDIPQPQPGEESEEGAESGQSAGMPEATEGQQGDEGQATGAVNAQAVEGMTEAEAAALLDSLRSKEDLLPFIDSQRRGQKRDIRDW